MQMVIVVLLFISVITFGIIENKRNNLGDIHTLSMAKANDIAANLIAYSDLLNQYIQVNYEALHSMSPVNIGVAEGFKIISNVDIEKYNLKNLHLIFNYKAMVFNYTRSGLDKSASPTLYLVITWDRIEQSFKNYQNVNLSEIAGQMNQLFSKRIYQGNGTFWTIPWVLYNQNCELKELYSQVPADQDNHSRVSNISTFFNAYCLQIEGSSVFRFLTYVYVQPIYKQ